MKIKIPGLSRGFFIRFLPNPAQKRGTVIIPERQKNYSRVKVLGFSPV
jgi:hypothetical protein